MTTQEVRRKLTAILHADVKGYSRLVGEDEESTARTLNVYKEVMTGLSKKRIFFDTPIRWTKANGHPI